MQKLFVILCFIMVIAGFINFLPEIFNPEGQEKAKQIELAKQKEKEAEEQNRLLAEAQKEAEEQKRRIERDAKEEAFLKKTKGQYAVFDVYSDSSWHLIKARRFIINIAKDPDSVKDVKALSPAVRMRHKKYPTCRYGISIQFRAKNSFGGYVVESGTVFLDEDYNGIALDKKLILSNE